MKNIIILIIFLMIIAPVSAYSNTTPTKVTAYIIDPPKVSVNLIRNIDTLNCTWNVKDLDLDEKLIASIQWFKNNNHIQELDKTMQIQPDIEYQETSPLIGLGENWKCEVKVTDKYNANGESFSIYTPPSGLTGFFLLNGDRLTNELDQILTKITNTLKNIKLF